MIGTMILLVRNLVATGNNQKYVLEYHDQIYFSWLEVGIKSFSLPVTKLTYPAITICKKNGFYDPGEYLRAIFNNFQYTYQDGDGSCEATSLLREHYKQYIGEGSCMNNSVYLKMENPSSGYKHKYVWIESLLHGIHIWKFRLPR